MSMNVAQKVLARPTAAALANAVDRAALPDPIKAVGGALAESMQDGQLTPDEFRRIDGYLDALLNPTRDVKQAAPDPVPPAGPRAELDKAFDRALADGLVTPGEWQQINGWLNKVMAGGGQPAAEVPGVTPTPTPRPEAPGTVEDRPPVGGAGGADPLPWGEKVSPEFRQKVREIAGRLQMDPAHLMGIMAFESGRTFSPSIRNAAGSGATGLIQFMPSTARGLGTTTDELARMTPEQQLDYVEKYFEPYAGRLDSLADTYMAVLWPRGIGKSDNYTLWSEGSVAYRQNRGLDANRDGRVTKAEAAAKVEAALAEGARFEG